MRWSRFLVVEDKAVGRHQMGTRLGHGRWITIIVAVDEEIGSSLLLLRTIMVNILILAIVVGVVVVNRQGDHHLRIRAATTNSLLAELGGRLRGN